jgi:hypothetical protein
MATFCKRRGLQNPQSAFIQALEAKVFLSEKSTAAYSEHASGGKYGAQAIHNFLYYNVISRRDKSDWKGIEEDVPAWRPSVEHGCGINKHAFDLTLRAECKTVHRIATT